MGSILHPTVEKPSDGPRILIIGAGSRGQAYARAVTSSTPGRIAAICEPIPFKRQELGRKYIWGLEKRDARAFEEFESWRDFVSYEETRRARERAGEKLDDGECGVDAVFVCVLDELHAQVVLGLSTLEGLHVMCEKPLATRLKDCTRMYKALLPSVEERVFGICHVLRYSPHNMMLRRLVREEGVVGEVLSVEHTEPVGWWHFSHSYVRGNWRREDTTAPSLLTKSCHDIDFLLWMLCSPTSDSSEPAHLPSSILSTGALNYFRKARKPKAAGRATNCLSCPIEPDCIYSAKKIYLDRHLKKGNADWPVKIVNPEIEDLLQIKGEEAAEQLLLKDLTEDYDSSTPDAEIAKRNWFGRCVWESDNTVCDDQTVSITWEDDPLPGHTTLDHRAKKSATFHMVAWTQAQCERRGRIYGTNGEIWYDSKTINVHNFATGQTETYNPKQMPGGHGGGDDGLAAQFVSAVHAVKSGKMKARDAQWKYLGCTLEEIVRSHALVFAAEEARTERKFVDWEEFWKREIEAELK